MTLHRTPNKTSPCLCDFFLFGRNDTAIHHPLIDSRRVQVFARSPCCCSMQCNGSSSSSSSGEAAGDLLAPCQRVITVVVRITYSKHGAIGGNSDKRRRKATHRPHTRRDYRRGFSMTFDGRDVLISIACVLNIL